MATPLKVPTIFSAIDKMSPVLDKIEGKVGGVVKKVNGIATKGAVAATFMAGALTYSANAAIGFEDRMSDVAKTTGLAGQELDDYGGKILDISKTTRTSIEDLQKIGAIGGQLGIAGAELGKFTESANKFAVALGGDYAGGVEEAITQVGKVNQLFKDTRKLDPSESLERVGSAINELTNIGATAQNMNDFVLRMGALPDAIKPAYTSTVALAAAMEKAGVNSQVGSSGLGALISKAGNQLPLFAKQMKLTTKEATKLFNTDTAEFAVKFAQSFQGMKADQVSKKLKELGINSNEVQKVVGALAAQNDNLNKSYDGGPSIFQRSMDAFSKMTSIQDEAAVKEGTTAAKIQQTMNVSEATAITLGQSLLPAIGDVLSELTPLIQEFSEYIKENKNFVPTIIKVIAALYVFKGIMIAMPAIIKAYNIVFGISMALQKKSAFYVSANTVAYKAYRATVVTTTGVKKAFTAAQLIANTAVKKSAVFLAASSAAQLYHAAASRIVTTATKAYTTAQWAINAAMYANPVGLIVAAIVILIGLLALGIYYWDEWGALLLNIMGPLGWIINMIMAFRKYWDLIVQAFEEEGIIGGLKKINQVFIKALLIPLRQALELLEGIPGLGKLATQALAKFDKFEMRIIGTDLDKDLTDLQAKQNLQVGTGVLASKQAEKSKDKGKLEIDLKAPEGWGVKSNSSGSFSMPINLNPSFNGN